jgi:hypothetical protein
VKKFAFAALTVPCVVLGAASFISAANDSAVYLYPPSTRNGWPNTRSGLMTTILILRAVAMVFSLGIGPAYAGEGDGQSAPPPFTSARDQSQSVSVDAQQTRTLFTIGRVGVHVWAPVPAPYNAEANGDLAARYLSGAGWFNNVEYPMT